MSAYTKGAQNAAALGDGLVYGDITIFSVAMTTAQTEAAVAHGLSAAPDWVLLGGNTAALAGEGLGWSATATTLTIVKTDTNGGDLTVSVLAANLS